MLYQEIMNAVRDSDLPTIEQAFRVLVDFPHEGPIHASGPGPLVVALRAVCEALVADDAVMPASTCDAVAVPHRSSYAAGAASTKKRTMPLAEGYKRYYEAIERRAI